MSKLGEGLKSATFAGGFVGGFAGLVVYVWAAIYSLQPALAVNAKLGDQTATLLTLVISFCGGSELSIGLGVIIGMLKAALLFSLIYVPMVCIKKTCESTVEVVVQYSKNHQQKFRKDDVPKDMGLKELVIEIPGGTNEITKDSIQNKEILGLKLPNISEDQNKSQRSSSLKMFSTKESKIKDNLEENRVEEQILKN